MLGEVNYFSQQLNLPTPHPIQITDVRKSFIRPPKLGFGGMIETTNFAFGIYKEGKLWTVINRNKHIERFDLYKEWAKTPSIIDTNRAHQLGTQWLSAVSVDVPALERKFKLNVGQAFFYDPPGSTNKTILPIYDVKWGAEEYPAVHVKILGTTKELMELTMNDLSFSRRTPLIVTNAAELNSRPDPIPKTLSTSTNRLARPPTKGKTSNDSF
jgi:hypothetical protein